MGEVHRARDTKLNRDVAIEVLLPAVANDPDRLARFSREAQVLASLFEKYQVVKWAAGCRQRRSSLAKDAELAMRGQIVVGVRLCGPERNTMLLEE